MRLYKSTASALGMGFLVATGSLSHADDAIDYTPLQRAMQKVLADRNAKAANDPVFTQEEPTATITENNVETSPVITTETPTTRTDNNDIAPVPFLETPFSNVLSYAPAIDETVKFPDVFKDFSLSHDYNLPPIGQFSAIPPEILLQPVTPGISEDSDDAATIEAEEQPNEAITEGEQTPAFEFNAQATAPINFDKPQHIVIDLQTGESILDLHADEQRQPASLVKVMTLWLAMDAIKDKSLTTSTRLPVPAGTARLSQGAAGTLNTRNTYTVGYLMNKAGTRSNAYATVALAVGVAKAQKWVAQDASADEAVAAFVIRMNEKAAAHNMDKTIFGNVTGMRTNYSTPRDMAKMFAQIYREHPALFRDSLGGKSHTSRFQRNFDSAIGSKTGTLNQCGLCLGSIYTKNGRTYVMVIFGMDSHVKRYGVAQNLYAQTPETFLPVKDIPMPVARPPYPAVDENNDVASGNIPTRKIAGPI